MDFWKTLLVLLRRWYVALPVFVVSVGAAGGVYLATPMHYQSTGVLVLTSPASGPTSVANAQPGQTNPLLAFESSLAISASIVIQSINTTEVVKELGADKPEHTFELTGGAEGGPFISVKTESASEEGSRALAITVLDRVRQELTKRQEALKAAPSTFIGVDEVVPPTEPEPLRGGKLRSAGVALVLGFAASLGAVFAYESFSTRKRREAGDDDEPGDEPEPKQPAPRQPEPTRAEPEAARPEPPAPPQRPAPPRPPVSSAERTQRVRPAQVGQPVPVSAKPAVAKVPAKGSVNGHVVARHDPPTVRMKPQPPPPEQRG